MSQAIESIDFQGTSQLSVYNVDFKNYKLNGKTVDYEALALTISKNRATAVEKEITPLAATMRTRNTALTELGNALADLQRCQNEIPSDDKDSKQVYPTSTTLNCLSKYGLTVYGKYTKSTIASSIQQVKTKIDALNNDAQADMTTLQSLVDKRDESYSTATDIMSKVSDGRSTVMKNI